MEQAIRTRNWGSDAKLYVADCCISFSIVPHKFKNFTNELLRYEIETSTAEKTSPPRKTYLCVEWDMISITLSIIRYLSGLLLPF
jgi:hypothetical protein